MHEVTDRAHQHRDGEGDDIGRVDHRVKMLGLWTLASGPGRHKIG